MATAIEYGTAPGAEEPSPAGRIAAPVVSNRREGHIWIRVVRHDRVTAVINGKKVDAETDGPDHRHLMLDLGRDSLNGARHQYNVDSRYRQSHKPELPL